MLNVEKVLFQFFLFSLVLRRHYKRNNPVSISPISVLIISPKFCLQLVAARQSFHFPKRSIPQNVSLATKLPNYCLCVHCKLLNDSQIWYPSISQRRQVEFFNTIVHTASPVSETTIFNSREHEPCPYHFFLYFKV